MTLETIVIATADDPERMAKILNALCDYLNVHILETKGYGGDYESISIEPNVKPEGGKKR